MNDVVGGVDGFIESAAAVVGSGDGTEPLDHAIDCETAGDFTGGCSAHSVAYNEYPSLKTVSEGVLIMFADFADIGESGNLEFEAFRHG